MSTRRHTALLLAAIALALPACVSRQQAAGPGAVPDRVPLSQLADLTLRVGDQNVGTEAMLSAAGELQNVPYRIEFSTFTSGPPMVEAAAAGKIDFAITGDTPPIFGAVANARIKVVSAFDGGAPAIRFWFTSIRLFTPSPTCEAKPSRWPRAVRRTPMCLISSTRPDSNPTTSTWCSCNRPTPCRDSAMARSTRGPCGILYRAGRTATPVRGLVTRKYKYSFGIASDQTLADAKRNTALADLLARYTRAAVWAREHPQEWAAQYAGSAGIDPAVAAVAQGRTLRQPIPSTTP